MAIGRTFREALLKGVRSLETGKTLSSLQVEPLRVREHLIRPNPDRLAYVFLALEQGCSRDQVFELTGIDRWFLEQIEQLLKEIREIEGEDLETIGPSGLARAKRHGFSDLWLAQILSRGRGKGDCQAISEQEVWKFRVKHAIGPVFKRVDTCAAEFESYTPYLYSSYEQEDESDPSEGKKIVILGSGPNRIGQGIEFDYCCCHASFALKEEGFETIMLNCNPETVSTDYDTSDRLYFEPLTFEDVMAVVKREKPQGVVVQLGGQTPLKLSLPLFEAGVPIVGTSPESIDLAEDRKRFESLLQKMNIPRPENGAAMSIEQARKIGQQIGYPLLVRPSYVLGGRAMSIVYDEDSLD